MFSINKVSWISNRGKLPQEESRFTRLPYVVLLFMLSIFPGYSHPSDNIPVPATVVQQLFSQLSATGTKAPQITSMDTLKAMTYIDNVVLAHVDTSRVAELVLDQHWHMASKGQQQRFTNAFQTLTVRLIVMAVGMLNRYPVKIDVAPIQNKQDANISAQVETVLEFGDSRIPIDCYLRRTSAGWKIYDAGIDDVTFIRPFRAAANAEIHHRGIEGLITYLEQKNQQSQLAVHD